MYKCPRLEDLRKPQVDEKDTQERQNVLLSNKYCSDMILQNILVNLEVNKKKWTVTAIITTDS